MEKSILTWKCKSVCVGVSGLDGKKGLMFENYNFCTTCKKWFIKNIVRCECCRQPLRMSPRLSKYRKSLRIVRNG